MKRALWAIFGILAIAGLVYWAATHPNVRKAEHLEKELSKLQKQNQKLDDENARLHREVLALKDDPRLAERRAREAANLARPGELIYQFEEPDEPIEVEVALAVKADELTLAGKKVKLDELAPALQELAREVPGAHLDVDYADDVDPIRRQRVVDVVKASPLADDAGDASK